VIFFIEKNRTKQNKKNKKKNKTKQNNTTQNKRKTKQEKRSRQDYLFPKPSQPHVYFFLLCDFIVFFLDGQEKERRINPFFSNHFLHNQYGPRY